MNRIKKLGGLRVQREQFGYRTRGKPAAGKITGGQRAAGTR